MPDTQEVLGFDINGVIIENLRLGKLVLPGDRFPRTKPVQGAFQGLAELKQRGSRIVVISMCKPGQVWLARRCLGAFRFYERTGIPFEDVHYCSGHGSKEPKCRELGVTRFVDDKFGVLSTLPDVPCRYLFQGRQREIEKYPNHADALKTIRRVESWRDLLVDLLR